jgi:gamma-glutamylcyclotransferase (GGCT)/AIG2-like uncharacterized protein YtfP
MSFYDNYYSHAQHKKGVEHPVFVYGTLRKDQMNYRRLLSGKYDRVEKGMIKNHMMLTNGAFPMILRAGIKPVYGDVFYLKPEMYAEVLQELDALEGYFAGRASSMYFRKEKIIKTESGTRPAWVYVWNQHTENLKVIESGNWFDYIEHRQATNNKKALSRRNRKF